MTVRVIRNGVATCNEDSVVIALSDLGDLIDALAEYAASEAALKLAEDEHGDESSEYDDALERFTMATEEVAEEAMFILEDLMQKRK